MSDSEDSDFSDPESVHSEGGSRPGTPTGGEGGSPAGSGADSEVVNIIWPVTRLNILFRMSGINPGQFHWGKPVFPLWNIV